MASTSPLTRSVPPRPKAVADHSDPSFATTLAHGLDVLSAFRTGTGALSNADLAASTGLSRPTVSRLTHTLAQLGYLKRDARGRFELGLDCGEGFRLVRVVSRGGVFVVLILVLGGDRGRCRL